MCSQELVKYKGFRLDRQRIIRCQHWYGRERGRGQSTRGNPCAARRQDRSLTCPMDIIRAKFPRYTRQNDTRTLSNLRQEFISILINHQGSLKVRFLVKHLRSFPLLSTI